MPEAMTCVAVSQMMVVIPRVIALTPLWNQGETADKPRPTPNINSMSESAAVVAAPANTALQATALVLLVSSILVCEEVRELTMLIPYKLSKES
jgi:hypothetical protein